MLLQSWHAFHPVPALYCLPAVVLALAAGVGVGQPGSAIVAASGAFLAGFGVFQRVSRLHVGSALLASLYMAATTALGTVAANNPWAGALCVGLAAFAVGVGSGLGGGPWWVLQQGAVAMVLAGSKSGDLTEGLQRAGLVLAGGLLQSACIALLRALRPIDFPVAPNWMEAPAGRAAWLAALRGLLRRSAPEPRFGLLLGLAAAAAIGVERALGLQHGYWVAMTVLLVLRRGGGETVVRGILRIGGTLLGAGVATLIVALLNPPVPALVALVAISAWGAYGLQWVNYGTYSASLTSYIAFLFALLGTPEPVIAAQRVMATLIGGALAMLAFGLARLWRRALARAGVLSAASS